MITDSFDSKSKAIINPIPKDEKVKCDVCIVTFSYLIEEYVIKKFKPKQVGQFKCVNGIFPVYTFNFQGKTLGFYKTILGAPLAVGVLEDVSAILDTKKFVVFGSAGALDKKLCDGKIIVPTHAYRDEDTSYHYAAPQDYIEIKNSKSVAEFMKSNEIPYVEGKCWTTDAFYRETKNNFEKRKSEGCVAVDMECSAIQAVCDFRNLEVYYFLFSGDLLDVPVWDKTNLHKANHNFENIHIALHLALELD